MPIAKDLEIKVSNGNAKLSEKVFVYHNDKGIELRLKVNLTQTDIYSPTRNLVFETSTMYASATVLKPSGTLFSRDKVVVIDGIIRFQINEEITEDINEVGVYRIQFHLYDSQDSRITLPPVEFEVKSLIGYVGENGHKEGVVDVSKVDTCVVADDLKTMEIFINGRYIKTEWKSGDLITAGRLNKIETALEDFNTQLSNITVDGGIDIEKIPYFTANDSNITSVKDALDKLLYFDLVISLSSTSSTTVEMGTTLNNVVFNWSFNKQIVSQSFNGVGLDKGIRTYTYASPFTSNKTFTLNANDGTKAFSRSIGFSFLNGRYWGVSSSKSFDSSFIKTLSKELSSSKSKTFTVNCGEGQHIYYCVPSRFGTCSFKVGGFEGGFNKISTIQFTNNSNYTENYDIYESSNSNLGNTTVVVS